jgi:hypothetical protein
MPLAKQSLIDRGEYCKGARWHLLHMLLVLQQLYASIPKAAGKQTGTSKLEYLGLNVRSC